MQPTTYNGERNPRATLHVLQLCEGSPELAIDSRDGRRRELIHGMNSRDSWIGHIQNVVNQYN